jgi:hypothetical protein
MLRSDDNFQNPIRASEGVVMHGDVKTVLFEKVHCFRQEERQVVHDEARPPKSVADVHGGIECA